MCGKKRFKRKNSSIALSNVKLRIFELSGNSCDKVCPTVIDANSPRLRQTADTPPAPRAAAVPTSSSCCPASSLFDGPGIYGSARVPLSSALRAGGQRLALRNCARVNGQCTLLSLEQRYPKKKKKNAPVFGQRHPSYKKIPTCLIYNKLPNLNSDTSAFLI